jgi:hypothetical protein
VPGIETDPTNFHGELTCGKAEDYYLTMRSAYATCFANWKKSGYHGDIPIEEREDQDPNMPFDDFVGPKMWLLYLHEYLKENPNILNVVNRDFDGDNIFSESTYPNTSRDRRQRPQRSNKQDKHIGEIASTMREKNASMKQMMESETMKNLSEARDKSKEKKRKSMKSLLANEQIGGDKK